MNGQARTRVISLVSIVVAIGCGSGHPQDASATSPSENRPAASPLKQLAEATPGAQSAPASQGSATVTGSVKFTGAAPAPEHIKMDADPQCLLQHKDAVQNPSVIVNANGTLQSVFVYVKSGLEGKTFPAPTQPASLAQKGCLYSPRVFGMQVNQPLEIVNDDATLHNVNCKPTKSKPFNIAQPTQGMTSKKQFTAPEVMVKCSCNVHPWMSAYIGVLDHPFFATTGEDGAIKISGLPAGQYTLEAWHEKYGTATQTVTVGNGETKSVDFEFKAQ